MAFPAAMLASGTHMDKYRRTGVVAIYALVVLFVALDIMRTAWNLNATLNLETNLTIVWTLLEPNIAVIICALPAYESFLPRNVQVSSNQNKSHENLVLADPAKHDAK